MKTVRILISVTLVLIIFSAMTSVVWAGNEATHPIQKLYRVTPETDVKKPFIIKFQSAGAMERFLSQTRLPGPVTKEFKRFDMIATEMTGNDAAELSRDRDIRFVEEESTFYLQDGEYYRRLPETLRKGRTCDPAIAIQSQGVPPPAEEYQWNIKALGADECHIKGFLGQGVKIGVIDTGIDHNHPDLHVAGGMWIELYVDYDDALLHGTHVAGIIAARRDNFGVVGVAPESELYSLKVFTPMGDAPLNKIIEAIQWSIDHKMDIVNMSFGSPTPSASLKDACQKAYEAGLLLVASAGNSGRGTVDNILYPARYDSVLSVGAIDENMEVADFSSRGEDLDVAAPGVNILSTYTNPPAQEHLYDYLSGTSMACPHVVGLAALIKSANPGISNVELRRRIMAFARNLGPAGHDRDYGWGLAQIDRADSVPDNAEPWVTAGGPYRGLVGQPVQFSASGTLDADDNFLIYTWSFEDGTEPGQGTNPTHTYKRAGDYTVALIVSDRNGLTAKATAKVFIHAGVERTLRVTTADAGYVKSPATVSLRNMPMTAGMTSGNQNFGIMRFVIPKNDDIFILSAELDLTGYRNKPTVNDGTVSTGLLPAAIAQAWPAITYDTIESAEALPLEPAIALSNLGGQVGMGMVNPFTVPYDRIEDLEKQFKQGSLAFRVSLDTTRTNNSYSWTKPELVVRYLESVSTENIAPVAHAGYDRRARTGTVVYLDGSASCDPDDAKLTYEWVQIKGTPVTLVGSPGNPVASFRTPSSNDVLIFELRVSDADHTAADQVTIYLNSAKSDVHQMTLIPGYGKAGYVATDFPSINFFDKKHIIVGPTPHDREETKNASWGETPHAGALQFDLSDIPPGSQVLSATLEITGADHDPTPHRGCDVRIMSASVDDLWVNLNWDVLTGAEVVATLSPHISSKDMKMDRVNRLKIDPTVIESRRSSTGKITLRIDGPTIMMNWYDASYWCSGNEEATEGKAPRLIITYGARDPVQDPEL